MTAEQRAFVLRHTQVQSPPCVSEISLHLAGEVMPLWQEVMQATGCPDTPPPYWAFAWAGGQALARYLLDHRVDSAGKSVLDLGSGSGLCAIAAFKAGATRVLAAEIDPLAGAAIALNAQRNGVSLRYTQQDLLTSAPPDVDLILAGDICYERALAGRVWAWLQDAHLHGIRVLIGDPGRDFFDPTGLLCLGTYPMPAMPDIESAGQIHASVFTFT